MKYVWLTIAAIVAFVVIEAFVNGPMKPVKYGPNRGTPSLPQETEQPRINEQSLRYFQRMLIQFGDDPMSSFGSDLRRLGFNGPSLQGSPVRDAFRLVRDKVMLVSDGRNAQADAVGAV